MSPIIAIVGALMVPAFVWIAKSSTRSAYETAAYTLLHRDGDIELRRYARQTLAETPLRSSVGQNRGFRRLFEYISGRNERSEKIAMTTPVFMNGDHGAQAASMAFVVPRDVAYTLQGAPEPTSPEVTLRHVCQHHVASIRFYGYRDAGAIRASERTLRTWMDESELTPSGPSRIAYYDPPWTPRWLRRNEVQIPYEDQL